MLATRLDRRVRACYRLAGVNYRRAHFRDAAQARRDSARQLLSEGAQRPQAACYLAHIALECAMKLRILVKYGAHTVEEFERRAGQDLTSRIFHSSTGHSLAELEKASGLAALLTA